MCCGSYCMKCLNAWWKHSESVTWKKVMRLKILKMKQDDMSKQSYSNYMILMISSDGKQSNVFSISVLLVITILSGFRIAAISLPSISLKNLGTIQKGCHWGTGFPTGVANMGGGGLLKSWWGSSFDKKSCWP